MATYTFDTPNGPGTVTIPEDPGEVAEPEAAGAAPENVNEPADGGQAQGDNASQVDPAAPTADAASAGVIPSPDSTPSVGG